MIQPQPQFSFHSGTSKKKKSKKFKESQKFSQESYSKFQVVILDVVREKLNLMLMEVCQLKQKVDFEDRKKLTCTILQKIANNEVVSAHITTDEAVSFLKLFNDCKQEKKLKTQSFKSNNLESNSESTFHDSPFS